MNILVLGSGAREHSICWSLKKSKNCDQIYCSPGNAGIAEVATCISIGEHRKNLLAFCKKNKVNLVVIGPEELLSIGITDFLLKNNINVFGPNKNAAKLETSKSFAKSFLKKNKISTPKYVRFSSYQKGYDYLKIADYPLVIKANGLAAGKGVVICQNTEEGLNTINLIMKKKKFGDAGKSIIIEEFIEGFELSYFAFFDKKSYLPLGYALDHKKAYDNDKGPNTGGMGCFTPSEKVTKSLLKKIKTQILDKTFNGIKKENFDYRGILFFGLIIKNNEPSVIEYNVRFGDPECQTLLRNLKTDLLKIFIATTKDNLRKINIKKSTNSTVCIVLASKGYPENHKKNIIIKNLNNIKKNKSIEIFHAGTIKKEGNFYSNGGRVLSITCSEKSISSARKLAYKMLKKINWDAGFYRKDIGFKNN